MLWIRLKKAGEKGRREGWQKVGEGEIRGKIKQRVEEIPENLRTFLATHFHLHIKIGLIAQVSMVSFGR